MILLTGARGFIGSRLKYRFSQSETIEVDRVRRDWPLDINSHQEFNAHKLPKDIEVVYHLAAQSGAVPSWEDPYVDAMDNILATIRIAEMFPDAKLIFTTSGAALQPESPYGLSKKVAEEYLKLLHKNVVILRLSSVYGEKDRGVVDTFIREDTCTIYGDGSAVRDFVHVDDIVEALIKAKDWPAGEYTLGSGKGTNVREIAEATGKPIEYKPERLGEKQSVILENTTPINNSNTRSWEPTIDVLEYVRERC